MELDTARKILLDHAKNPRNKNIVENFHVVGECKNPICGDHVKIHLELDSNLVKAVQLEVKGCTICTATASIMSEEIKNKSKIELIQLKDFFEENLLKRDADIWPDELKSFEALGHLRVNPARIPCSLIPWYALKQALLNC